MSDFQLSLQLANTDMSSLVTTEVLEGVWMAQQ
jgi:hypothetical protein